MFRRAYILLVPVALTGCLAAQLREPVENMAVSAEVAAEKHQRGELTEQDVQAILDELATQAHELEKIVTGDDGP